MDQDDEYHGEQSAETVQATHGTRSLYPAVKRRPPSHNKLCEQVRKHLESILGKYTFRERNLVSVEEAEAFALTWDSELQSGPSCCDIDSFRIALDSDPTCAWNMSASRVFAHNFLQKHHSSKVGLNVVAQRFIGRICSLKKKYKQCRGGTALRLTALQHGRRMSRKNNVLFHRRRWVFNRHPDLRRHLDVIDKLGVAGMSSDDSDHEQFPAERRSTARPGQSISFVVLKPQWRSELLSEVLHLTDSLYPLLRTADTDDLRGAAPHHRIRVNTIWSRSRKFPKGQPRNSYDYAWRMRKSDLEFIVAPAPDYNYDEVARILRR
ncbi:hypothetical protein CVT24_013044 [Panaeolus cyanescens]|uniref:Uncharacterized protein n=1 Tax=Panaeolus cyanescens TaxID=181874 RepID=A0A409X2B8_9AGAR|nr:hypothetical protein CVT24_013044 [Panaeolus cyanescens]